MDFVQIGVTASYQIPIRVQPADSFVRDESGSHALMRPIDWESIVDRADDVITADGNS